MGMIIDNETNFVYLSEWTKKDFPKMTKKLTGIFEESGIAYDFLKYTEDYYCRDYMPIQVTKDKFVQFVFNPVSYFKPDELKHISNPVSIQINNKLPQPIYSRLILDGGNLVKGKSKVIITDKVFRDNEYQMSRKEIRKELETILESEVIIIPSLKDDKTGHADAMMRFIDQDTVLINKLNFEDEDGWEERFLAVLSKHGLQYEELPVFDPKDHTAVGLYINYLHVGRLIVLPFYEHTEQKNENEAAFKQMKKLFPDCTVEYVDATKLAKEGGVLNCATWNILK